MGAQRESRRREIEQMKVIACNLEKYNAPTTSGDSRKRRRSKLYSCCPDSCVTM
eukprot:NODE_6191_length_289_cov_140.962500_g5579_i0.p1 GENE.NODE_6191_length_289_cov_140.962500_g5579_i0~~NODE_6191_length_289_cov_140.962500_g5579_i0.p1  ORF type:complete len:54 (+),score=1.15 NODE_6191_length_289_cov_140.962500_g5579_i0:31-192(+)